MKKSVKITDEVHSILEAMSTKKRETYNDIIKRAVQHYNSCPIIMGQEEGLKK